MSDLSKRLGLDRHPNVLNTINNVVRTAEAVVKDVNPAMGAIISEVESATATVTTPNNVSTAVEDIKKVSKVLIEVDPNLDQQIITAVNNILAKCGLSFTDAIIDSLLTHELNSLGL